MPIKETSITRKFEYESPDGDSYRITYLENETDKRKYIEIVRLKPDGSPESEPVRWDYDMLVDLADTLRHHSRKPVVNFPVQQDMSFPKVTDYRGGSAVPLTATEQIEQAVNQTMNRYDNSAAPIESWNKEAIAYHENATGVGVDEQQEVPETPEDISLQSGEDGPRWKREAAARMTNPARASDPGKRIKPVSAQDMI